MKTPRGPTPDAGSNSTGGVAMRNKLLSNRSRARAARRGGLWAILAVLVGAVGSTATATATVQRGDVRTGPRNVRIEIAAQEVDSILWRVRWVQPQVTGGGDDPQTYEWEADVTADPVAFSTDADRAGSVPGGTREASFWTAYACPDSLYVHARVRGHGQWREGTVTPWSEVATGSFSQDCPLPPMPPPPEVTVDTVQTDTTDLDLAVLDLACALQPAGYWADRGLPDLPAEPEVHVQADLRTMSGTGSTWGSRSALLRGGEVVAEESLAHGGWQDSVRYVRLGSGFTLPEYGLAAGADYAVRFEVDAAGEVEEPDESNNRLTTACPEVS